MLLTLVKDMQRLKKLGKLKVFRINTKKTTFRYITANLLKTKDKEQILKAAREKRYITYKEMLFLIRNKEKKKMNGLPWWFSGQDSELPLQGAHV